jgi:hypothetical protein
MGLDGFRRRYATNKINTILYQFGTFDIECTPRPTYLVQSTPYCVRPTRLSSRWNRMSARSGS